MSLLLLFSSPPVAAVYGPTPPTVLTPQDTITVLADQSSIAALSDNSTTITLG